MRTTAFFGKCGVKGPKSYIRDKSKNDLKLGSLSRWPVIKETRDGIGPHVDRKVVVPEVAELGALRRNKALGMLYALHDEVALVVLDHAVAVAVDDEDGDRGGHAVETVGQPLSSDCHELCTNDLSRPTGVERDLDAARELVMHLGSWAKHLWMVLVLHHLGRDETVALGTVRVALCLGLKLFQLEVSTWELRHGGSQDGLANLDSEKLASSLWSGGRLIHDQNSLGNVATHTESKNVNRLPSETRYERDNVLGHEFHGHVPVPVVGDVRLADTAMVKDEDCVRAVKGSILAMWQQDGLFGVTLTLSLLGQVLY